MSDIESFKRSFGFRPEGAFLVGVERECFITNEADTIVPEAPRLLTEVGSQLSRMGDDIGKSNAFGYELSACQIETRIGPSVLPNLRSALTVREEQLNAAFEQCGLRPLHYEVAPDDMPLTVYPDPTGRYAEISANMSRDTLLAACQVIGTHVHIGMPDHETALRVYDTVIKDCATLCSLGDGSDGRRMEIYRKVAPDCNPQPYGSWENFHTNAVQHGFADDPRRCWTLIRISIHGTLEFRMFGATSSIDTIVGWAEHCHAACLAAV